VDYDADEVLDRVKLPIHPASDISPGSVHSNLVEGVITEIAYDWHQGSMLNLLLALRSRPSGALPTNFVQRLRNYCRGSLEEVGDLRVCETREA
jgi:hypothetical protein